MNDADVLVVGGGVVGLALAWRLALGGARVVVLERGEPGAEASHAAAGMLSPQAEAHEAGGFLELLRLARSRFPALATTLRERTGIDVEYDDSGTLLLALSDADERVLEERYRWQSAARLPVEWLGADALRALEPALSHAARFALRFPDDHQVENRALARALLAAARAAGAEVRGGAAVRELRRTAGGGAVRLEAGAELRAERLVLAAGCWSGGLAGLPRPVPVEPVHGQLVALAASPPPFRHVVDSPRAYLVPRAAGGRVIVGATVERTGFRKAVTPAGLLQILGGAVELCAALDDAPFVECWSGLRPATPDALPILGPDPDWPALVYATGHYRNGILLAPLTAELLAEQILTGRTPLELTPYGIGRF